MEAQKTESKYDKEQQITGQIEHTSTKRKRCVLLKAKRRSEPN